MNHNTWPGLRPTPPRESRTPGNPGPRPPPSWRGSRPGLPLRPPAQASGRMLVLLPALLPPNGTVAAGAAALPKGPGTGLGACAWACCSSPPKAPRGSGSGTPTWCPCPCPSSRWWCWCVGRCVSACVCSWNSLFSGQWSSSMCSGTPTCGPCKAAPAAGPLPRTSSRLLVKAAADSSRSCRIVRPAGRGGGGGAVERGISPLGLFP